MIKGTDIVSKETGKISKFNPYLNEFHSVMIIFNYVRYWPGAGMKQIMKTVVTDIV